MALTLTIALSLFVSMGSSLDDFRAFYYAGTVAREGLDPYLTEPLHGCELETMPRPLQSQWRGVAIPAPVPPYAVVFFELVSLMPFATAGFVWCFINIAAVALIVVTIRAMTSLPYWAIILAVALPVFGTNAVLGQVVPVAIAAVCASAWLITRAAWSCAAVAAAIALVDPRLGLPLCASLMFWLRPMQIRLAVACLFLLLAASLIGFQTNVEYVTTVLPAHALSEAASFEQYSLTVILYSLGMPPTSAVWAGTASFVVMVVAGLFAARATAQRFSNNAFIALVPPACAVISGPFIHLTQIAVAIPVLLLLISSKETHYRSSAVLALTLLSVPWPMAKSTSFVFIAPVLTFAMLWWLSERTVTRPVAYSFAIFLATLALREGYINESKTHQAAIYQQVEARIPSRLAESTWAHLMWTTNSNNDALSWAKRVPTWTALLVMLVALLKASVPGNARPSFENAHERAIKVQRRFDTDIVTVKDSDAKAPES